MINLRSFAHVDSKMAKKLRFLVIILSLTLPLSVIAAEGFSSLEEQMSGKEFTTTGLDKLTPDELEALNNWIRRHSVATLDQPKGGSYTADAGTEGDQRGFKNKNDSKEDRSPINSRIKGNFSGWNGQTVFVLENGMIWEQADKGKFWVKDVQNPEITIKPGFLGTWNLFTEGHNSSCKVKRIQ